MLQTKPSGQHQVSFSNIQAFQQDNNIRRSSKPISISVIDGQFTNAQGVKNVDKYEAIEQRQQQEKSVYFQNLLIGDSPQKRTMNSNPNILKYSQTVLDSRESLVDIPNETSALVQTIMSFNKNNQQPLKKGNIITFKSQNVLPSQSLSLKPMSSQKEQRYNKSTSEFNVESFQMNSSTKQKQKSQQQFTSGVSNHFQLPKKVSSQVTLKTIINLNHGAQEKRQSVNSEKGQSFYPQDFQSDIQPERNVVYVKDRFIDTREQGRKLKRVNGTSDSHSTNLDSTHQNNYPLSTANNTAQKQYSNKKGSSDNLQDDGIAIGQFRYSQSNSIQTNKPFTPVQAIQEQQHPSSPSLMTKTITILKKPSSRHQPSRMKFTTVTRFSSQSKMSLPSTPFSNNSNIQSDFPSIRGNSQGRFNEDMRPLSTDSPTLKKYTIKQSSTFQNLKTGQYSSFNSSTPQPKGRTINSQKSQISDFNIARALVGEQIPNQLASQQSYLKSQSSRKLNSQSSMNHFHNVQDNLLNSVRNLNQDQQNFLQRSLHQIIEVFPKSQQGVSTLTQVSHTMNDLSRSKKQHTDRLKTTSNVATEPRENVNTQKSMKRITFNIDESDSEDEKPQSSQGKKSYSYLKDYPINQEGNAQEILNQGNEIFNINQIPEDLLGNIEENAMSQGGDSQPRELTSRDNNSRRELNSSRPGTVQSTKLQEELSNITEGDSENQQTDVLNGDINLIKKYQNGIDIEKELLQKKIEKQRTHQNQVQELISTIQNNALENHTSDKRMQRSNTYNFLKEKSKMNEEKKQQKKKEFEENLQMIKEKNEYKNQDLERLEVEFATGGKFNQKNYNNLKINKLVKRSKQQISDIFKKTIKLLQRLNIQPSEVISTKIFSSRPFEKERSQEFFACVKANNVEQVSYLLRVNKYLVYEYDYLFMTPLHWACKRGLLKMVQLLIRFNSDMEAEDMLGRTPLFFSIESNWEDVIECLLVNKASPYKTKYVDYAGLAKTYVVSKMLSICRRLHWAIKLNPNPNKEEQWRKEVAGLYTIRQQQQYLDEEQQKKKQLGLI